MIQPSQHGIAPPKSWAEFETVLPSLDGLGVVAFAVDAGDRVVVATDAAGPLLARDGGPVLGQRLGDLLVADPSTREAVRKALATGEPARGAGWFQAGGATVHAGFLAFPLAHPDGAGWLLRDVQPVSAGEGAPETLRDWREIFDRAPAGAAILAPDGRILRINAALADLVGYPADQVVGRPVAAFVTAEEAAISERRIAALAAGTDTRVGPRTLRRRDGSSVEIEGKGAPILGPDGAVRYVVTHLFDVDERAGAEEALRASEERFRAAFEAAPVGMALLDTQERFLRVNPALAAMLGYPPERLVGQPYRDFVAPQDAAAVEANVRRALDTGYCGIVERHFLRADGGVLIARVGGGLMRDPRGAAIGLLVVANDITAEVAAFAALRESEARYRLLAEANPHLVWMANPDGAIETMNGRWTEMTGLPVEAALGEGWICAVHPEDVAAVVEAKAESTRGGVDFRCEYRTRMADGSWRWTLARAVPLRDADGRILRWYGTVVDVDDMKQAEAALRSTLHLQAIGQLAAGVAHEVNNMMAVVMGFASLLQAEMSPLDRRGGAVREILSAAKRTAEITRQLLAYARRQVLQPETVDLGDVLLGADPMIRRLIAKEVDYRVDTGGMETWVVVDRAQIEQVMVNLALNARDAMPEGGRLLARIRHVHLRARRTLRHPVDVVPAGHWAVLEVRDTGYGMEPQVLSRALDPFFTTKPIGTGTGLGLCTVYGIVRQSGGYLALQSEPGKGTRAEIYLPLAEAPAERVREEPTITPHSAPGRETVLVVDDEESVRMMLGDALRVAGYTVLEASGGAAALDCLSRHDAPIHALVTDLAMPGMGGGELGRRARSLRPGLRVLHVSGYAVEEVTRRGLLEAGAALLEKPFTLRQLSVAVRRVLDAPSEAGSA